MNTPDENRYENMKYARCGNSGLMLPKISLGLWHNFGGVDVYLSLLSVQEDGSRVAIKAFLNPMVAWLWWSLPLFVIAVVLALWPKRRSWVAVDRAADTAVVRAILPRRGELSRRRKVLRCNCITWTMILEKRIIWLSSIRI